MYTSLLKEPRAQRALLDAYYPDWERGLSWYTTEEWIDVWIARTAVSRRTAQRWIAAARLISSAQLAAAA